ncbi:MAG: hypothetical protein M1840_002635 [Geoglossum simile]|nr:MAG: hypothetical protein M1840_002635 [Geoglossum simile]
MAPTVLHLRSETKPLERRSPLSPTTAKALLDVGYVVNVERSPGRVFSGEAFEAVGATLVPEGSWVDAPTEHNIVGLKELPEDDGTFPPALSAPPSLSHPISNSATVTNTWDRYLSRFARGGGTLYDIEFLTDDSGRRVSAFGYYAGYAGAAVAFLAWSHQAVRPTTPLPSIPKYSPAAVCVADASASLASALPHNDNKYSLCVFSLWVL